ncbi:molecular chaperone DnaK [Algoriphagus halophytocola]|uniref:Molecular chaperone DnaK n=1 Tax=Algoriphagus halophytocola TaxID=2991499 RepID=A0ABY6MC99_9BACT|nr:MULTISPECIES: molecular chaperone DnaK [unclassified Algoriphagus]UZD21255.1 molecular chaperone DnaK [Algoriphagus sp. TR-M5]WBL42466.1 molecular chaperone DnaK [Algoriphagus sp. TR-M9]
MKIDKKDFESMKDKYDKEVKKGKPAKGVKGKDKDNQTDWIFVTRKTLEGLLAKADEDPSVGGIQFYMTEYTEETAEKSHPGQGVAYTGQLALVMRAANLQEGQLVSVGLGDPEDEYEEGDVVCPYHCEPPPTNS